VGAVFSDEEHFVRRDVPFPFFKVEYLPTLMTISTPLILLLHHPQHMDFVAAQRRCAAFIFIDLENGDRCIVTVSQ
jgi:hypothetical protein